MNFEEFCENSNGVYTDWHYRGMVCLIPKEHIFETFNKVKRCEDLGLKITEIPNNRKPWENMEQFGRPDVTGLCKIGEGDVRQVMEKMSSLGYLLPHFLFIKTGYLYKKNSKEWNDLVIMKEKEEYFLKKKGNIVDIPKGINYNPGYPFFYTETHWNEPKEHTHLNLEGNQMELYNEIKPILEKAGISSSTYIQKREYSIELNSTVDYYRIRLNCSCSSLPLEVREKIYDIAKEKYSNVRMGKFDK